MAARDVSWPVSTRNPQRNAHTIQYQIDRARLTNANLFQKGHLLRESATVIDLALMQPRGSRTRAFKQPVDVWWKRTLFA